MSESYRFHYRYHSKISLDTLTLTCIESLNTYTNKERCSYKLKEVSSEEIFKMRLKKQSIVVLKYGNNFYYCEVPKDFCYLSKIDFGPHLCAYCGKCYASKKFGCQKVIDSPFEIVYRMLYPHSRTKAMQESKRIEKYDWITLGIESINTEIENFIVLMCKIVHFLKSNCKNKNPILIKNWIFVFYSIISITSLPLNPSKL